LPIGSHVADTQEGGSISEPDSRLGHAMGYITPPTRITVTTTGVKWPTDFERRQLPPGSKGVVIFNEHATSTIYFGIDRPVSTGNGIRVYHGEDRAWMVSVKEYISLIADAEDNAVFLAVIY